jgi:hypothetical protein
MQDDERCCGTGTCIIDAQGHCWCGQQWDGQKMCRPAPGTTDAESNLVAKRASPDEDEASDVV